MARVGPGNRAVRLDFPRNWGRGPGRGLSLLGCLRLVSENQKARKTLNASIQQIPLLRLAQPP